MKFSFLGLFNKSSKKSPEERNDSADINEEESKESENSNDINTKINNSKKNPPKNKKFSLLRRVIIISMFFIVLLIGVIVGLLSLPKQENEINRTHMQSPVIKQQAQTIELRYNAIDPVSGDWGITANELVSRLTRTFEKVGIRNSRIGRLNVLPSEKEFRHSFSPALSILGELSESNNVQRVAIYYDPAFYDIDFPLAMQVIRALITAIDPSLELEDISTMMDSLEISSDTRIPQRQTELRHKNFVFRVWSVAGSAFVFTISSDN